MSLEDGTEARYEFTEDTEWSVLYHWNEGEETADWGTDCMDGDFVEIALDDEGIVTAVSEPAFDVPPLPWVDDKDIDGEYSRIRMEGDWYRVTADTVFVDVDAAAIVPWSQFQHAEGVLGVIPMGAYTDGDLTLDIVPFGGDEVSSYGGGEDIGIVTSRVITADGVALNILAGGAANTYLAADAEIWALVYSNWNLGGSFSITDIDAGDLVEFEPTAAGDEVEWVGEPYAQRWSANGYDSYYLYVSAIDADNLIVEGRLAEDPDELADDDFEILLTPDTVYYDATGAPAEVDFEDIDVGDVIQVFGDKSAVEFIKIAPEDDVVLLLSN